MSENPQQAAKPVQNKKVSVPSPIMIIAVILVLSAIARISYRLVNLPASRMQPAAE